MTDKSACTRQNFLKKMIDGVFIHHSLKCISNISDSNPDRIEYVDTDIIDSCKKNKFGNTSKKQVSDLFEPIFKYKGIKVEVPFKNIEISSTEFYQSRARNYIKKLIQDDQHYCKLIDEIELAELEIIFKEIINLIFPYTCNTEKPENDPFHEQEEEIRDLIKKKLLEHEDKKTELGIVFESDLLFEYSDINNYISDNKMDYIDLNETPISTFSNNTVYKYKAELSIEIDALRSTVNVAFSLNGTEKSIQTEYFGWIGREIADDIMIPKEVIPAICFFTIIDGHEIMLQILKEISLIELDTPYL